MGSEETLNEEKRIKRFYRSQKSRVIGGVCGGIAEYFEFDVAIVRILTVLLALFDGVGLIIYLVALFIVPLNPEQGEAARQKPSSDRSQVFWLIIGGILLIFGFGLLVNNFHVLPNRWFPMYYWGFDWDIIWPLLLIALGIFYIFHISRRKKETGTEPAKEEEVDNAKRLFRSRTDKKIAGVCGGLAAYFNVDPTIVRVLYAILTIVTSIILGLLAYVVMAIVIPEEELHRENTAAANAGEGK
ncbi:MAG: PspC domain-containing protein [bacterium]